MEKQNDTDIRNSILPFLLAFIPSLWVMTALFLYVNDSLHVYILLASSLFAATMSMIAGVFFDFIKRWVHIIILILMLFDFVISFLSGTWASHSF